MNMYALGSQECANDPETLIDCDEPQVHTAMANAMTFAKESSKFALMSIYEQRMNRAIHKNLQTFRDLQAERKLNYKKDRAQEVALARYSDIKGLAYEAPISPTPNGSVFSNDDIFAAANRLTALQAAKIAIRLAPFKVQYAGASSSGPNFSTDFPNKIDPGTSQTNLSTPPGSGANPSFLSR
jgi:hypothetical protein